MTHIQPPHGFTECEVYRGFTIAVRDGRYAGFGPVDDTRNYSSRADVRAAIDRGFALRGQ